MYSFFVACGIYNASESQETHGDPEVLVTALKATQEKKGTKCFALADSSLPPLLPLHGRCATGVSSVETPNVICPLQL